MYIIKKTFAFARLIYANKIVNRFSLFSKIFSMRKKPTPDTRRSIFFNFNHTTQEMNPKKHIWRIQLKQETIICFFYFRKDYLYFIN